MQAQQRDFLLQGFEGSARVALAAVFRLYFNVKNVGDGGNLAQPRGADGAQLSGSNLGPHRLVQQSRL